MQVEYIAALLLAFALIKGHKKKARPYRDADGNWIGEAGNIVFYNTRLS